MTDVKVGTVRSRTKITGEGTFEEYYEVEFFVGDARHKLAMSPDGWTAEKAEEAVRARAKELTAIQGKTIKITPAG